MTAMVGAMLAGDPSVDLTRTWVYAGNERMAMGGAGLGFATGAPGLEFSPAALAWRRAEQTGPVVVTGTAGFGGIGGVKGEDLGDQGGGAWRASLLGLDTPNPILRGIGAGTVGAGLLYHRLGVGVLGTGMAIRDLGGPGVVETANAVGAVALTLGDRAAVGVGAVVQATRIFDGTAESRGLGVGAEAGFLMRIPDTGVNLGLTARTPTTDGNPSGSLGVDKMVVPAGGSVGVSWASNAMPTPPSRRPLRVALGLVVDGPVQDAVSAESLAQGAPVAHGARWSFGPRLGASFEVWPQHLRVLGGSYLEPSRVTGTPDRVHGTGGLELGMLPIHVLGLYLPLSLRCGFDLAPRFQSLHWIGIDIWHTGVVGGPVGTPD